MLDVRIVSPEFGRGCWRCLWSRADDAASPYSLPRAVAIREGDPGVALAFGQDVAEHLGRTPVETERAGVLELGLSIQTLPQATKRQWAWDISGAREAVD